MLLEASKGGGGAGQEPCFPWRGTVQCVLPGPPRSHTSAPALGHQPQRGQGGPLSVKATRRETPPRPVMSERICLRRPPPPQASSLPPAWGSRVGEGVGVLRDSRPLPPGQAQEPACSQRADWSRDWAGPFITKSPEMLGICPKRDWGRDLALSWPRAVPGRSGSVSRL